MLAFAILWTRLTLCCASPNLANFKVKCASMNDNASSYVSKLPRKVFEHKRFAGEKIMGWPFSSIDLNPIENLWSIVKMKLYEGGKQYNNEADL